MGKVSKVLDQSLIICWCHFTMDVCDTTKSPSFFWQPVAISSLSAVRTQTSQEHRQLLLSITLPKQRKFGANVVPGLLTNNAFTGTFPHYILRLTSVLSSPEHYQKIYLLHFCPSRSEVKDTSYLPGRTSHAH